VTDAGPLIDYIRTTPGGRETLTSARLSRLESMLRDIIAREGAIAITKDVGLFVAYRK